MLTTSHPLVLRLTVSHHPEGVTVALIHWPDPTDPAYGTTHTTAWWAWN